MSKQPTPFEPHPLVLFSTYGSRPLANRIAGFLNIPLGEADDTPFPDGESFVQLNTDVRGRDVFVVCSTCRLWEHSVDGRSYSGVNDSFMELMTFGDTIARASAHRKTAVLPYFGYSRQDRKTASRTPISARMVATMIEQFYDRVIVIDLHSAAIQGFFSCKCILDHLNVGALFCEYVNALNLKNSVILSADLGNLKKADKYRSGMKNPMDIAVVDKRRDKGKVETKGLIGDVEDKTVLLFDDMISTASTMRLAIDLALKNGAKEFIILATHGLFVGGEETVQRLSHPAIKKIVITDTVPLLPGIEKRLPLEIVSVGELLAKTIKKVHKNESISELLGKFG